jgi:hypothetical protein
LNHAQQSETTMNRFDRRHGFNAPTGAGAMNPLAGLPHHPAGSWLARALLWLVLVLVGRPCGIAADPATADPVYLRRAANTDGVLALEVGARELVSVSQGRPSVWLVGVIHLGTADYYAALQDFLDARSLVLYEGIGAEQGNFELQDGEFSLQDRMASALGLVFQLGAIHYDRPNFRNSDLGFEELAGLFGREPDDGRAAGSDGTGEAAVGDAEFNMLMQIMQGEGFFGGIARMGVSALASSPRLQATMKVMLIEMMSGLPANLAEIAGMPDGMKQLMDKLITARNDVVLRDLRRELAKRGRSESIAVFYGAGHMADLEERLCRELKLRPGAERWFTALSIDPSAAGLSGFEVGVARSMARLQLRTLGAETAGAGVDTKSESPEPSGDSAH